MVSLTRRISLSWVNAFPRLTFGFNYNVEWKGFDFGMFWQGVGKRDMMLRGELIEPFHANISYNIYKHQLDFWTPTNTDARWPRLTAPGSTSNRNNYGNGQGSDPILDGWKIPASEELADWLHIPQNMEPQGGHGKGTYLCQRTKLADFQ